MKSVVLCHWDSLYQHLGKTNVKERVITGGWQWCSSSGHKLQAAAWPFMALCTTDWEMKKPKILHLRRGSLQRHNTLSITFTNKQSLERETLLALGMKTSICARTPWDSHFCTRIPWNPKPLLRYLSLKSPRDIDRKQEMARGPLEMSWEENSLFLICSTLSQLLQFQTGLQDSLHSMV